MKKDRVIIGFPPERARRQIATYTPYEELMSAEGFTRELAHNILTIAGLIVWDAFWLFRHGKKVPMGGKILDIGTKLGGSLISMYYGAMSTGRQVNLIGIEPKVGPKLLSNIGGLPVEIIETTSDKAAGKIPANSIDLVFIDGNHKYRQVKKDIFNYWPKLKQGGVMLGHDYYKKFPGVKKAVEESFPKFIICDKSVIWKVRKSHKLARSLNDP